MIELSVGQWLVALLLLVALYLAMHMLAMLLVWVVREYKLMRLRQRHELGLAGRVFRAWIVAAVPSGMGLQRYQDSLRELQLAAAEVLRVDPDDEFAAKVHRLAAKALSSGLGGNYSNDHGQIRVPRNLGPGGAK